ncbi:MAG: methionine--tRNA ligase [Desulfobacterales bacterium]
MTSSFYITTPIYYVNARPHLGHAYTTIVADVARRFAQMCGLDTFLLTGTDEHGDKIVRSARAENLSPKAYVDMISGQFKALWPKLNVHYDRFIRTTEPRHMRVVERILQRIYDSGDIYFSEYEGRYCFGCERFYTERELVDGKCPDHQTVPENIKESNYFFKMNRYQQWLIDYIHQHPDFIRPERYKNEVLAFLREPLEDLCISRPKKRLQWGITLPFDPEYVTYVWFDALINYISALNYPDGPEFKKYWPHVQHVVAKDILKPHGIYWPILLKAAGIPIFRHLNVHGYWNVDDSKMSKSLGNVVAPLEMKEVYGLDAFRFFLMRDMVFGLDSSFSESALVERINSDLANDFGNLFSRVLTMAHKYYQGKVPEVDPVIENELQLGLDSDARQAVEDYASAMEGFEFHKALLSVWSFVGRMNRYIDVMAPWELAKNPSSGKQLDAVIYNLLEGLRVLAGLVYPVMPETADKMRLHLGLKSSNVDDGLASLKAWNLIRPGMQLLKSISLFPRIERETRQKSQPGTAAESASEAPAFKPEISLENVNALDLRVGTILSAHKIPRAKKLLQLEVDIGEKRTIVAGIADHYNPESLKGRQVVIVANLKPAKLMGVLSKGMALAAGDEQKLALVLPDKPLKPGTPLR